MCHSDACLLPMDVGPCDADIPRWFFNVTAGECQAFSYGGCEGNENNFETFEACFASCSNERTSLPPIHPHNHNFSQLFLAVKKCRTLHLLRMLGLSVVW